MVIPSMNANSKPYTMPMLPHTHGRIFSYPAGLLYASKVTPDTAEMTNPVIIGACNLLISKRATMTPNVES